ncbi:MAG: OmpA family protein [Betaproteobacteria bacterium]|nr:OmpA family protein [Betaproteobacteria bacterium]
MKKLNRVMVLFALAALAAPIGALAQSAAKSIDNWRATDGTVWKNGTNELCWRDAGWTPATADEKCDGAIKPSPPRGPAPPPPAQPVAPPVAAPLAPAPRPAPPPAAPIQEKVTFAADALFDFDRAVLKPGGASQADRPIEKAKGVTLEVVIAVGHTDTVGNDGYNQKLSINRAEAVKSFLVGKGIEKSRVYTEGKGSKNPVADNKTAAGRAKNRRVEVEVVGTRARN